MATKLPNGIPVALNKAIRNGGYGVIQTRPKFSGYYEIIGAHTHGNTITYTVRLHHSTAYQEVITVNMEAIPRK